MSACPRLLSLLADGRFHSGEEIGAKLSVSRTAVWKRIRKCLATGLIIHSVKGKGYRLSHPVELLEHEKVSALLDAGIMAQLSGITIHAEIDSTNQYLLDKLDQPDFHGHVVLAEYQSAGRGRRGRRWVSPFAAGISLSLGWYFDSPPEPAVISLGPGVAVMRVLIRNNIHGACLKWPNDVFWQNRKLGGTLVEVRAEAAGPCRAVIGIGINHTFPQPVDKSGIDQPCVDIATVQQPPVSRNLLAAQLISELVRLFSTDRQQRASAVIDEWRRYDGMRGQPAEILLPGRSVSGRIQGIDDQGALLLLVNNRLEKFSSGEISLRVQK